MDETETLPETNEPDSLEGNFYNLPNVESPSIATGERGPESQLDGKETSEISDQTEHQLEQSTTRELVLQELTKSGRGEGFEVREPQGTLRFSEDGKELINEEGVSITKLVEESGDEEAIAMHYESLQQFRDGGDAVFINKEQPGDEDPDTMHGSYMILNSDGSISWGLTERRIERSEEEGTTGREEDGAPVEDRWTTLEHTEDQIPQFDASTEVLAQLAAAQEADVAQPATAEPSSHEEVGEQTAVVAIETIASPTVDSAETVTHDTVETGGVLIEAAHELSETESVSTSEVLDADPLESLPVFETQGSTAHVPEVVVPDAVSSQATQALDIRETSMYQAIVALLKNDTEAISVSEKPDAEAVTEPAEEMADSQPISESREAAAEDVVMVPIENSTASTPIETQSQPTETAQDTGSAETTTTQIPSAETPVAESRVEEKIDIATILRDTDNTIRIAPEVVQEGPDRKIDETESPGVRSEASERQVALNAHEILLRTLGIREKTVAIREERPYNDILRAGNPTIQLSGRVSTQPRGRTLSNRGISLIEV